jgi:hypothetical protein
MIAIRADDSGPECTRALDLVTSLEYRVIILHMSSRLARLVLSLAEKRNMMVCMYACTNDGLHV